MRNAENNRASARRQHVNPSSVAQAMMVTGSRISTTGADVTQTTKGVSTHDVSSQIRRNASDPAVTAATLRHPRT